jgi:hypothetical protein
MTENSSASKAQPSEDLGSRHLTEKYQPGSFEVSEHFYPRVLNAQIHPLVQYFLSLSTDQIIERYCHLNSLAGSN